MSSSLEAQDSVAGKKDSLTADQTAAILQQLQELETAIKEKTRSSRGGVSQTFQRAAGSSKAAYELFLKCKEEVDFVQNGLRASDFSDAKKQLDARYREKKHLLEALRFQTEYIALTLRASETDDMASIQGDLRSFMGQVVRFAGTLEGADDLKLDSVSQQTDTNELTTRERREIAGNRRAASEVREFLRALKQPITSTAFARAYNFDRSLKMEDWSMTPGNFSSIFEKSLLPFARTDTPEKVGDLWNERIKYQSFEKKVGEDPAAFNKFVLMDIPDLRWARAKDIFQYYSESEGSAAMFAMIKDNSTHPSSMKWVEELRGIVVSGFSEGD